MHPGAVGLPSLFEGLRERFVQLGSADVRVAPVHPPTDGRPQHRDGLGGAVEHQQALGHHEVGAGVPVRERIQRAPERIHRLGMAAFPLQQQSSQDIVELLVPSPEEAGWAECFH